MACTVATNGPPLATISKPRSSLSFQFLRLCPAVNIRTWPEARKTARSTSMVSTMALSDPHWLSSMQSSRQLRQINSGYPRDSALSITVWKRSVQYHPTMCPTTRPLLKDCDVWFLDCCDAKRTSKIWKPGTCVKWVRSKL